jgi:VCBS repeat-containing protein
VAPTATPTDTPTATFAAGVRSQGVSAQAVGDCSPVAVADAYSVVGGATLSVPAPGVLGNDTDPNSDPLTAVLDSPTTRGALVLNANGSFTYTPGENTIGTDSFTYHANDGTANSNTVTVTLTVQAGCDGRRATQVGTAGNDELGGSGGNDVIVGLGGNDVIEPGSGTDIVCGGSGRDNVRAGSGNDTVFGGSGDDTLDGGSGNDRLFGEAGIDRLFGGGDNDALDGGADSPDRCDGEGGSDTATTSCETIISAT